MEEIKMERKASVQIMLDTVGIPHTFLKITDENGTEYYRGFTPKKTKLINEGKIDQTWHESNKESRRLEISKKQFNNLMKDIDSDIKNPPIYDLPNGAQCATWAMDKLQKAGILNSGSNFDGGFAETLMTNPYLQAYFGINTIPSSPIDLKDILDNKATIPADFLNPYINPKLYDPLVLDLNKNGLIDTISLENSNVYFDHNGDKVAFKTSWISKDYGLLVLDKNSNGKIDNGNELFGNFTIKNNTKFSKNGFDALRDYDENSDNVIDAQDEIFKELKIWQDINENGIVDESELKTLKELEIKSLDLNAHNPENKNLDVDNSVELVGSYTKFDNSIHTLADINFSVDTINSIHKEKLNLTQEQQLMPNIKGFGFLRDLNEAATLSDELNETLKTYIKSTTRGEQLNILTNIVSLWSKTQNDYNENFTLNKTNLLDNSSENPTNLNIRDIRLTPSEFQAYKNFTISSVIFKKV